MKGLHNSLLQLDCPGNGPAAIDFAHGPSVRPSVEQSAAAAVIDMMQAPATNHGDSTIHLKMMRGMQQEQ